MMDGHDESVYNLAHHAASSGKLEQLTQVIRDDPSLLEQRDNTGTSG